MSTITLMVMGAARGKSRPRFNRKTGQVYTDTPTVRAEANVVTTWLEAGRPKIEGQVPLRVWVTCVLERPKGHRKADGSLSAAGLRSPVPTKKPDLDNLFKLYTDALNGRAYRDDSQIVEAHFCKVWASPSEWPHTRVEIELWVENGVLREAA